MIWYFEPKTFTKVSKLSWTSQLLHTWFVRKVRRDKLHDSQKTPPKSPGLLGSTRFFARTKSGVNQGLHVVDMKLIKWFHPQKLIHYLGEGWGGIYPLLKASLFCIREKIGKVVHSLTYLPSLLKKCLDDKWICDIFLHES